MELGVRSLLPVLLFSSLLLFFALRLIRAESAPCCIQMALLLLIPVVMTLVRNGGNCTASIFSRQVRLKKWSSMWKWSSKNSSSMPASWSMGVHCTRAASSSACTTGKGASPRSK